MGNLRVTVIDVGWGDSIFLETVNDNNISQYALIDSNDTTTLRSSYIFLKRFFEKQGFQIPTAQPLFEWVLLTHAHADHGQGLKRIFKDFGTQQFWYPKSTSQAIFFTDLLRYAQKSSRVVHHQALDSTKILPPFGNIPMNILWPPYNKLDKNENNNSVILTLTLGDHAIVLTGDAEVDVWNQIASQLPPETKFFKVPHHGSDNAMFDVRQQTPWLNHITPNTQLAISSHVRPFEHPSTSVINKLNQIGIKYYRTDTDYHITFETDGQQVGVKYSHF